VADGDDEPPAEGTVVVESAIVVEAAWVVSVRDGSPVEQPTTSSVTTRNQRIWATVEENTS
jgi:hypothetical protein